MSVFSSVQFQCFSSVQFQCFSSVQFQFFKCLTFCDLVHSVNTEVVKECNKAPDAQQAGRAAQTVRYSQYSQYQQQPTHTHTQTVPLVTADIQFMQVNFRQ